MGYQPCIGKFLQGKHNASDDTGWPLLALLNAMQHVYQVLC